MKRKWIIAVMFVSICCIVVLAVICFPNSKEVDVDLPAVIFLRGTDEVSDTSLRIKGDWTQKRCSEIVATFKGKLEIEADECTDKEETVYRFTREQTDGTLLGTGGYKSNNGTLEAAALYTDEEFSSFVFFDTDCIVVAPARTLEEAFMICDILGLEYPIKKN